ncbi:hypothetical protein KY306_03210 [Candidatus Woesearchaeota archaeon]|nr:hypothetical protein [Candidatus Woesearchaeota archaeon]
MNLKNDLNLAFKPKMLSSVMEIDIAKAIKFMSIYTLIWLVIHIIFALINGLIDGKALGGVFLFSTLTGLSSAILIVLGLFIVGLVAGYCSKWFKGMNDITKTIGLVAYGVLPIVIIAVVRDLLLFISTIGGHFLATGFFWVNIILFIITFIWLALLATEAIGLADTLKKGSAFVCFILGFIVAALINWPINWVLVKIVTAILAGVI